MTEHYSPHNLPFTTRCMDKQGMNAIQVGGVTLWLHPKREHIHRRVCYERSKADAECRRVTQFNVGHSHMGNKGKSAFSLSVQENDDGWVDDQRWHLRSFDRNPFFSASERVVIPRCSGWVCVFLSSCLIGEGGESLNVHAWYFGILLWSLWGREIQLTERGMLVHICVYTHLRAVLFDAPLRIYFIRPWEGT